MFLPISILYLFDPTTNKSGIIILLFIGIGMKYECMIIIEILKNNHLNGTTMQVYKNRLLGQIK